MGSFPRWRRRQWLVDKRQQVPFASVLLVQITLIAAALGYYAYAVNGRLMDLTRDLIEKNEPALAQAIYKTTNPFLASVALVVALTAVVQIVFGIYTSHKLAGPVVKMNRLLKTLAAGDSSVRAGFRRGDYLDELAEALNSYFAEVDVPRQRLLAALPRLQAALDGLETGARSDEHLAALEATVGELTEPAATAQPQAKAVRS